MKRGDIVKLKQGFNINDATLFGMMPRNFKEQDFYLVSTDAEFAIYGCFGMPLSLFEIEEAKGYALDAAYFTVVAPAGTPDISELIKESEYSYA